MRTALLGGGIAGALLGVAIVTSGPAQAVSPGADPSPAASPAPASQAPAASPSPNPIISPIITQPSTAAPITEPPVTQEAPASAAPSAKRSVKVSAAPATTVISPTGVRFSPLPTSAGIRTTSGGSGSGSTSTNTQPYNAAPAPTGFAATDGGEIAIVTSTPDANGNASSVTVIKTAKATSKKLGHFSVTDLLLVLLLSAGGVAIVGAGGLWLTRR